MKSSSVALTVVDAAAPATWAEAKRLVEKVRSGARAWLELGEVLEELRAAFFAQGGSGRFGSPHHAANRETARSPHDAANGEKGWQAKVRDELGISDDTARRWMLDCRRHQQLIQITEGTVTEVEGHKVTPAAREKAAAVLSEIASDPSIRPARKWAGVWSSVKTKGSQRAAVDHAMNISNAIAKLKTSLPHWREISPDERAFIEKEFIVIRDLVEGTLL